MCEEEYATKCLNSMPGSFGSGSIGVGDGVDGSSITEPTFVASSSDASPRETPFVNLAYWA